MPPDDVKQETCWDDGIGLVRAIQAMIEVFVRARNCGGVISVSFLGQCCVQSTVHSCLAMDLIEVS